MPRQKSGLESLVEDYMAHVQAVGGKLKTMSYYESILKGQLLPWCEENKITDPAKFDTRAVERFAVMLRSRKAQPTGRVTRTRATVDKKLKEATVNSYLRAVNAFVAWCGETPGVNIEAKRIKLKRLSRPVRKVLSAKDIDLMERKARDPRDKLLIRLLGDTGMRASEVLGLTVDDLLPPTPLSKMRYLKVTGKGDLQRKVPVHPDLYKRLENYRDNERRSRNAADKSLFQGLRKGRDSGKYEALTPSGLAQMCKLLALEAGVTNPANPHGFRHSFITRGLRRKVAASQIARIVGHKTTQMIYTNYDQLDEEDDAQALYDMLRAERQEIKG